MRRPTAVVLTALIVALAGCGGHGGSNDTGALDLPAKLPATGSSSATVGPSGRAGPATYAVALQGARPPLSWLVEFPALPASGPAPRAVDASLRASEEGLLAAWLDGPHPPARRALSCTTDVLLDTVGLLSVRTTCTAGAAPAGVLTATYDQADGARLALGDVLSGAYLPVLSAEAVTQLTLGGTPASVAAHLAAGTPAAFARWALDPTDLEVTFTPPAGPVTVDFPYTALAPYLAAGGPVARR